MTFVEKLAAGCPSRIVCRGESHCKALIGQPNGSKCTPEKCAALYMADALVNELRAEIFEALAEKSGRNWIKSEARSDLAKGGRSEHATRTAAPPKGD